MEELRSHLKTPLAAGILGFVLGLFIGLVILGWWLWPVEWKDAAVSDLRADLKADYLSMAIDSFSVRKDLERAKTRWDDLGPDNETALDDVRATSKTDKGAPAAGGPAAGGPAAGGPDAAAIETYVGIVKANQPSDLLLDETLDEKGDEKSQGLAWLVILFAVIVVAGVALAALYYINGRKRLAQAGYQEEAYFEGEEYAAEEEAPAVEAVRYAEAPRGAPAARPAAEAPRPAAARAVPAAPHREETPIAQFMTTFTLGDDLFDDSFAIDSPSGEFLGECGVGISETIGVGEPKKATALELWLFDKNDIQTVTKVLMTQYAINDHDTRQRLFAKGEPVLAKPGTEVRLETAALVLTGRVVDMRYGSGPVPPESYFDRITLELTLYKK